MNKQLSSVIGAFAVLSSFALPHAAFADSGLDVLKALAQGVKATQDKMKQGTQTLPQESANGGATQGALDGSVPSEADDDARKAARAKMDVVGVKIGSSLDEALRVLNKHNPKLKVVQKHVQTFSRADNKPHPVLHFLASGEQPRAMEQIYLTTSLSPGRRVVHIDRQITYQLNNAPTVASTLATLRNKYGDPTPGSSDTPNNRHLFWSVGMGAGGSNGCNGFDFRIQAWGFTRNHVRQNCGFVVSARVRPFNENPALVTELAVGITDFRMASQDWESSYRYLASEGKERDKIEVEEAKNRAPKI